MANVVALDMGRIYFDCQSKVAHLTERAAYEEAYRMWAEYGTNAHHYKCPSCPAWHVGRRRTKGS